MYSFVRNCRGSNCKFLGKTPQVHLSFTERLSDELHKSEVLLIASILLVVKAANIYRNTSKMHITIETELSF